MEPRRVERYVNGNVESARTPSAAASNANVRPAASANIHINVSNHIPPEVRPPAEATTCRDEFELEKRPTTSF